MLSNNQETGVAVAARRGLWWPRSLTSLNFSLNLPIWTPNRNKVKKSVEIGHFWLLYHRGLTENGKGWVFTPAPDLTTGVTNSNRVSLVKLQNYTILSTKIIVSSEKLLRAAKLRQMRRCWCREGNRLWKPMPTWTFTWNTHTPKKVCRLA